MQINPYTINIPQYKGKRYVISDIHGCSKTLKALIEKISLTKDDQLFLLGDYIDRGPDSMGVIDYLLELQQEEYNVFPIRGNHEEELLFINKYKPNSLVVKYIQKEKIFNFFSSSQELKRNYFEFFHSLPYFIELDNYFLVHAGFNFNSVKPFEDIHEMIDIRNWKYNPLIANNKTIIHGHDPHELNEIEKRIKMNDKIIPLDNGCVFDSVLDMGNLLCLELETFSLICQKNIDDM